MAESPNQSIGAFNQLVDDLIALRGGHPDDQIRRYLRGENGITHYLGMGKEVVIDGPGYLIAVNGDTRRAEGDDYLQRSLHIHALGPKQTSERRRQAVRLALGSFSVFSGVREGREALHEQPSMDYGPGAALVAPFGEWAVRSAATDNARKRTGSHHPDPFGRMRLEDHPTAEDLERIREFAASGEHVYTLSVPDDGWLSEAVLMVPIGQPSK